MTRFYKGYYIHTKTTSIKGKNVLRTFDISTSKNSYNKLATIEWFKTLKQAKEYIDNLVN